MSVSNEIRYREQQKVPFGKDPPIEVSNTLEAVFSMRGGISYCFESQYKKEVAKVVLRLCW